MYAIQMRYINYFGDSVFRHLPGFKSHAECSWWSDWFSSMLASDHATSIVTSCVAIAT